MPRALLEEEGFDPGASSGLFIGISEFGDRGFAPIPFAVDDAIDLAHLFTHELELIEPAKVVLALAGAPVKEASADRFRALLDSGAGRGDAEQPDVYALLADQAAASGETGLLVVSIATHGFSDQGGDYLVAADSLRRRIARTGLAVDELFDDVSRAPAPRRLLLLDACRERLTAGTRAVGETASAMSPRLAEAIATARGQAVLAGTTLGGYSYDDPELRNGVFTAAVVEGLRGAAATDARGFITLRTLADYVDREVSTWVRTRLPDHASLSQGIARRIEGPVGALPLAADPKVWEEVAAYRERRERALARLRENVGPVISGSLYDEIAATLPSEGPPEEVERLFEEIEALDGSERNQRALVHWFEAHRETATWGPTGGRAQVKVDPEPPAVQQTDDEPEDTHVHSRALEEVKQRTGIEFVRVPGGEFKLGAYEGDDRARPVHRVKLRRFWIGKRPVTNAQYGRFLEATGHREPKYWKKSRFNAAEQPVVGVSWKDAHAYCDWAGVELPSEAQWEAAARGDDQRIYPWGNQEPTEELGSFSKSNLFGRPDPVGSHSKGASPYGAEDLVGGVTEWCKDVWLARAYEGRDGEQDPVTTIGDSDWRVGRGSSWAVGESRLAARRHMLWAEVQSDTVGFRVVYQGASERPTAIND